jgi:hypothetical protein
MKHAISIVLFIGISLAGFANGSDSTKARGADASAAEVKYLAGKDGDVLFNVVYNNVTGQRFSVLVVDEFGNQIYQHTFSDKQFDRKFKLADPESTSSLTFVIRNYGDNSVQRFRVDASNRLIEDVTVKEVTQ